MFQRDGCATEIELHELKESFSKYLINEGATRLCQQLKDEDTFTNFFKFIQGRELRDTEAKYYLEKENNFLVEMFIQFVKKVKPNLPSILYYNLNVLQKLLWQKPISSYDYDERISAQSLQFQIDNYYDPKDQAQRARIDIVLSILQPKEGEKVLDVGCGVGTFVYHCAKKGAKAVGIDYSRESINVARQLAERFGVSANVEFIHCDAKSLPYPDMSFDKVVAVDFIEHIEDSQKRDALLEMLRVLKPGGFIIIFTPNGLREWLRSIKTKLARIFGLYQPQTRLHYGLINRFKFERILKGMDLVFIRKFFDIQNPYLTKIPVFKEILSLNLLWIIRNKS